MKCELHVAAIMRSKSGLYLLNRRPATKTRWPNLWANVGGRVEIPETPEDAVRREVMEEIGLEMIDIPAISLRTYQFDGGVGIKYVFAGLDDFDTIENEDGLFMWMSYGFICKLAHHNQTVPLLLEDHVDAEEFFQF